MERIVITGAGSISPLGFSQEDVYANYSSAKSFIHSHSFYSGRKFVALIAKGAEEVLVNLRNSNPHYKHLDRSVLLAILAARQAMANAKWNNGEAGVNIGSSRGATETYENRFEQFLESDKKQTSVFTSPTTTLGNISSWVMQDLNLQGPLISHSITCSTGLQAIANAVAWIKAGMAERFLAGAAEAPLTDFTLAQMAALKIYSTDNSEYPCRPFSSDVPPQNRMVLGEGAAIFALEKWKPEIRDSVLGEILSIGFGSEKLSSPSSISPEGDCLYRSMNMAVKNLPVSKPIDLILCHAPGTINGDNAELNAIKQVFGENLPILLSNKWQIGHTLGASGVLSLEYALHILKTQNYIDLPYPNLIQNTKKLIKTIMINAAGFGGNAMSIVIGL